MADFQLFVDVADVVGDEGGPCFDGRTSDSLFDFVKNAEAADEALFFEDYEDVEVGVVFVGDVAF